MYIKMYLYLIENGLLYSKQFVFQKKHPTDYAIFQLADQIHDMFNKSIYTLGVSIYLSKGFATVDETRSFRTME